ncbi:uncharacterized protein C8A04DRAFT_30466 [Dichotomopilus funicola]|uniref:Uncharacterized protein n=1 Tax=Dichotomopilus funicola TaxID=1934379 RepID=A0AAN6UZJ2_9PEZI|nr:hypothetical protein C8A04DRAFT_30466 [Dichotomopilus funicola]
MRSFAATIPVLASFLALAAAGEIPLTPVATYPAVRPTLNPENHNAPIGQRPPFAGNSSPSGQPSVFVLTQVSDKPAQTSTPTNPEKCSQVAARITPQLTPTPTYSPSLKGLADKLGGVDRDTCGEMDFKARFKTAQTDDINRFNQARHSSFILPIWAKVSELWNACGDETHKISQIAKEPCYRWALELSKASNSSFGSKANQGPEKPPTTEVPGNIKTPELENGVADSGISHSAAIGFAGVLAFVWGMVLA